MITSKKLSIQPFNQFYYDCGKNAIFTVAFNLDINIEKFLFNETPVYVLDKGSQRFYTKILFNKNEKNIFLDYYVEVCYKSPPKEQIVKEIIDAIDSGNPVVLCVDQYFLSYRKATYNKVHGRHYIVVFGYDSQKELFDVIDNHENLFGKNTLEFSNIVKSQLSITEILDNVWQNYNYISFHKNEVPIERVNIDVDYDYLTMYGDVIHKFSKEIRIGLQDLCLIRDRIIATIEEEEQLVIQLEDYIGSINSIINHKRVERHKIAIAMSENKKLLDIAEEIVNDWSFIRGILAKFQITRKYNKRSFDVCKIKLANIVIKEKEYYFNLSDESVNYNVII